MKTIAFHNLGCKVNSYEMDYMIQKCSQKDLKIVEFEQKADIYVVNTCSVTNIADRKSRQMLHKAKKLNPEAVVVAVGCFVQANPEEVAKDEAIDIIIGNNKKKEIFEIIEEYFKEKEKNKKETVSKDLSGNTLVDINNCEYEEMKVKGSSERSRVYVKIQDGCDRYCTYCIIPFTRGNLRSRKKEDIIEEIKMIAQNGYKEVVLTGIHISSYGKDITGEQYNRELLLDLFGSINSIDGIERIRIGSFEPMIITEDFAKNLSKIPKVCPHFHISLQSGCDTVLKRMNRHYNTERFFEITGILRKYFKDCALTTDIIVGFPNESEEEFKETYEYLKKIRFFETHIFPYSRRKGTIADRMAGQLTMNEKKERVAELIRLDDELSKEYRMGKLSQKKDIIVEEIKEINGREYYVGHTGEYIFTAVPKEDNDCVIGEKIDVRLESMLDDKTVLCSLI